MTTTAHAIPSFSQIAPKPWPHMVTGPVVNELWDSLHKSAMQTLRVTSPLPSLAQTIVLQSASLAEALSRALSRQQMDMLVSGTHLADLYLSVYREAPALIVTAAQDLIAVTQRDPAATNALIPLLYFKGFHALQTHRIAHWLWQADRREDALFLQNRSSVLYAVDIHPAAKLGHGIILDHATGLVIGETAIVEDNVSLLHQVTLGGTGKERGDRHPKIRKGVMIGAGATVLGNVEVGAGACIAAGSVVLQNVPPHTTVAGIPARVVGKPTSDEPALEMDQLVIK